MDANWYVDSGAIDHLTSDLDRLSMKEHYKGTDKIHVANGAGLSISYVGDSHFAGSHGPLILKNVLRVPNISKNLLSIHRLASDNKVFLEFIQISFLSRIRPHRKPFFKVHVGGGCIFFLLHFFHPLVYLLNIVLLSFLVQDLLY